MKMARKRFRSPFVVEKSKLMRLLEVSEAKLTAPELILDRQFTVYFSNSKVFETNSIDDVFGVDNSERNKVERLSLSFQLGDDEQNVPAYGLIVDFDGTSPSDITIAARSNDGAWAGETLSVVEEQVERMIQKNWMSTLSHKQGSPFFSLVVLMIITITMALGTATLSERRSTLPDTMWLSPQDLKEMEPLQNNPSLSKEKLGEVLSRQLTNVIRNQHDKGESLLHRLMHWHSLVIIAPGLVMILAFLYLSFRCYPPAVFPWGDGEESYRLLLNRRKFIWTAVVASLLIGILANLFVLALGTHS